MTGLELWQWCFNSVPIEGMTSLAVLSNRVRMTDELYKAMMARFPGAKPMKAETRVPKK